MQAEATVPEGGTIHIRCNSDATTLQLLVPGVGCLLLPVVGGRIEYTLPPQVRAGHRIIVSDLRTPAPSNASVEVVGGSSR